jgi:hypothetical protein
MTVPEKIVDATVNAYYPQVLQEGASARARAQSGYTIAAALAAAVTTVGIFTGVSATDYPLAIAGVVAVAAWIVSALLYLWAVSSAPTPPSAEGTDDPAVFVGSVISAARDDRDIVQRQVRFAGVAALVATLASAATIALVFVRSDDTYKGPAVLTSRGQQALSSMCGGLDLPVRVQIAQSDIDDPEVNVTLIAGCRNRSVREVVLDRRAITALTVKGGS